MGLWTRVQLPSGPLEAEQLNRCPIPQIVVFRNVVSIIIPRELVDGPRKPAKLTFELLQKWIEDNHGVTVSKSSISQVKNKCGLSKIEIGAKCKVVPELKSEKEKLVFEAFKHFQIA